MRMRSEVLAERRAKKKIPLWERNANPEQLQVIRHETGPCRVLAAAGSGKTRCVTMRIARLVNLGIVEPQRIVATTFSKKAADEMNKRLKDVGVTKARVGTWHSLCLQILREDNTEWASWEIDGQDDKPQRAKMYLKDVLGYKQMNWKGADLSKINSFIGRCKANLFDPSSPEAMELATKDFGWQAKFAVEAFHRYNESLKEKEVLTYDDFMVFVVRHFEENEEARLNWASKYDHGLNDEVQDNNRAQQRISHLLFDDHGNYMAVGDVGQSIYKFRGSSPEFLAGFDQEWPGGKTIWLPRNYRSGRKIIDVANKIIRPMKCVGFEPKDMIGSRDLDGEVVVRCAEALDDEAAIVVDHIAKSVQNKESKFSGHTVLYRINAQSRAVEEALLKKRIPYVVVGGVSFYERREVRDLLAYLRLAAGRGKVADIKRSINTPFRFLGTQTVEKIMDRVDEHDLENVDWPAVVEEVAEKDRLQARQRASANEWSSLIRSLQEKIKKAAEIEGTVVEDTPEWETRKVGKPASLLEDVIRQTRYIDWIQKEEGSESTENSGAANVREMVRVAERFQTTEEVLDYIDDTIRAARKQREDKQAGGERVLLMSVHRSKGLEYDHVYVLGLNEDVLPHIKGDPEEERRVAYVAVTRARDFLMMTYVRRIATRAGVKDVAPSRFLVDTGLPLDVPESLSFGVGPGSNVPGETDALPELPPLP